MADDQSSSSGARPTTESGSADQHPGLNSSIVDMKHSLYEAYSFINDLYQMLCTVCQDKVFDTPTILLSGSVSGEEEIPAGVQAVLVRSAAESPDILSHVSVRARNAHVLLGVCFDPEIAENLVKIHCHWFRLRS